MKKVRKLSPATLKRLIAEEKYKLKKEMLSESKRSELSSENKALLSEIKKLLKIKKAQKKRIQEFKVLQQYKKSIKKKIAERV